MFQALWVLFKIIFKQNMKKLILILSLVYSSQIKANQASTQELSSAMGVIAGHALKEFKELELQVFLENLKSSYNNSAKMSIEQAIDIVSSNHSGEIIDSLLPKLSKRKETIEHSSKKETKMSEVNKSDNEIFLEKNKTKKGMITTNSGLQYTVEHRSDSNTFASETSEVYVHYKGKLLDGSEFDSSYSRGEPTLFQVNRLIPGMTEALLLLPIGSKATLYIPPELGYGSMSPSPRIPGNSILVFEIELVKLAS